MGTTEPKIGDYLYFLEPDEHDASLPSGELTRGEICHVRWDGEEVWVTVHGEFPFKRSKEN